MWDLLKETPYERRDRQARERKEGKSKKLKPERYDITLNDGRKIAFGGDS